MTSIVSRTEMFDYPNKIIDLNELAKSSKFRKLGSMSWEDFYKKHYVKAVKKEFRKQNLYQKNIWVDNKKLILTKKVIADKNFNDCDIFYKIFNMYYL